MAALRPGRPCRYQRLCEQRRGYQHRQCMRRYCRHAKGGRYHSKLYQPSACCPAKTTPAASSGGSPIKTAPTIRPFSPTIFPPPCRDAANTQTVTGQASVGGIVGAVYWSGTIRDCHNSGSIVASGNMAGGILGNAQYLFASSGPAGRQL